MRARPLVPWLLNPSGNGENGEILSNGERAEGGREGWGSRKGPGKLRLGRYLGYLKNPSEYYE